MTSRTGNQRLGWSIAVGGLKMLNAILSGNIEIIHLPNNRSYSSDSGSRRAYDGNHLGRIALSWFGSPFHRRFSVTATITAFVLFIRYRPDNFYAYSSVGYGGWFRSVFSRAIGFAQLDAAA